MSDGPSQHEKVWRLALVGHPVGHSLSAVMHNAALAHVHEAGSYSLLDTLPSALADALASLRAGHWDGLNVTVPHKVDAAALCDALGRDAMVLGAVNTLVRQGQGRVIGYNTDVSGLDAALTLHWPSDPCDGRDVCVIGAGGAARSAVAVALRRGARKVWVTNRTLSRAQHLVDALSPHFEPERLAVQAFDTPPTFEVGLVVQASSMGMGLAPSSSQWRDIEARAQTWLAALPCRPHFMDLVYRPARTPWVAAAISQGLSAHHGLEMLVQQARRAFALWTGHEGIPANVMRVVAEASITP